GRLRPPRHCSILVRIMLLDESCDVGGRTADLRPSNRLRAPGWWARREMRSRGTLRGACLRRVLRRGTAYDPGPVRSTGNCGPTSENATISCGTHHLEGGCSCVGSASGPWGGVPPAPWARDSDGSEASCSDCRGDACSVSTGIAPPAPAAAAACSASATGSEPRSGSAPGPSPSDGPFPDDSDEDCSSSGRALSDEACSEAE